jgi:glycosyltransferase involved in cell wall biosynthesis/uncharacterized membrane protein
VLFSLAVLSLFAVTMIGLRIVYTQSWDHIAIGWNLLLAWIPFVAALVVSNRAAPGAHNLRLIAATLIWLLFLPNAPYLITDLKYVGQSDSVPVLYDVLLLFAAALTGLLLGLLSLLLMHVVARRFVGPVHGWALVGTVLALTSFGIYLGRIHRWNSWDLVVRPTPLFDTAWNAVLQPRAIALTGLFTCFLAATYLVLHSFPIRPPGPSARLQGPDEAARRPRVLLLITLAEVGGAQTYLSLLLPAIADCFDVTVAAHGPGPLRDAARAAGARFVPLTHVRRSIRPLRDVLGFVELVRLFRREQPQILHANSSKAGVLGRLAAPLAGVPIRIFTVHGWAFAAYRGPAGRLYLWADRIVRPLTTLVICVARRERELGVRAGACVPDRSVVVHNAVDIRAFARARSSAGMPRIISVGRFAYPKDYATLVEALAAVETEYHAILVGGGPARSVAANDVRRRGLARRVELLGPRPDVPELLASADLFVLSSRSEGLPISILEAMATGLPVVATDVGGVSELVVEGTTGLLVPPGDSTAFADAVERLLRDPDLRRRFGGAARLRAEQHFDVTCFRDAHIELYRRELERGGFLCPGGASDSPSGESRFRGVRSVNAQA